MEKSWGYVCVDFFSLLWKFRGTSPVWVLTKELHYPCGSDSVLQKPSPVCLQLLIHGTGSCGWENKGSSDSVWGGVTELCRTWLTWEEGHGMKCHLHPPFLSMGHTGRSGWMGNESASTLCIECTLQEGRAMQDSDSELLMVMKREAVANLSHLPYLQHATNLY